ncbi:hypothetical protein AO387_21375 [Pseudomonas syringae ICMP 11168]|uniref:DUF4411 family protein n=1 Tax=Pseudomonas syringae TaxID=317 RepID=UPI000731520F|nr:DUF4411 family protein [Pseudomonas syringae]KTB99497.1 hypothetical protein AO387_21375 [Pseudomonas syringae ICMP 11168]
MHKYLIDSNIFLQAKNLHYRFEFCSHFWSWVKQAHGDGMLCSIQKVKNELIKGKDDDPVKLWMAELPDTFFIPDDTDARVILKYREVMQWTAESTHFKDAAKKEFARSDIADAFLIAVAMAYGYEIITHELSNPDRKNKIQIPDAARAFGVKTHFVYDVLSENSSKDFCFSRK